MSIANAVSAFTQRGARRATAPMLVLYSAMLALVLLALSVWIVSQASEPPGGNCYQQTPCLPSPAWRVIGLADVMAVAVAPRQESGGALVALGVAGLLGFLAFVACALSSEPHSAGWAFLHPGGALDAAMLQHDGLWRRLSSSSWRIERFEEAPYASD